MEQQRSQSRESESSTTQSAEEINRLLEKVYDELRRTAHFHRLNERENLTLQTTDLVHEAYMRLASNDAVPKPNDERHLKALNSRIIRRILVDHARKHKARKRDAGAASDDPRASDRWISSPSWPPWFHARGSTSRDTMVCLRRTATIALK